MQISGELVSSSHYYKFELAPDDVGAVITPLAHNRHAPISRSPSQSRALPTGVVLRLSQSPPGDQNNYLEVAVS